MYWYAGVARAAEMSSKIWTWLLGYIKKKILNTSCKVKWNSIKYIYRHSFEDSHSAFVCFIQLSNISAVKPVLRDHCHERQSVLKDQIFLPGPTFQCNWTCHQRPPILKDRILWLMWWSYKTGSTVHTYCTSQWWKYLFFFKWLSISHPECWCRVGLFLGQSGCRGSRHGSSGGTSHRQSGHRHGSGSSECPNHVYTAGWTHRINRPLPTTEYLQEINQHRNMEG